ncbi:MAG: ankyrin repeat domain-containing protein [Chlamydiales bacterium]|nr:ankyrin repeat domain-containing protein [Chlamydiales bacterium]
MLDATTPIKHSLPDIPVTQDSGRVIPSYPTSSHNDLSRISAFRKYIKPSDLYSVASKALDTRSIDHMKLLLGSSSAATKVFHERIQRVCSVNNAIALESLFDDYKEFITPEVRTDALNKALQNSSYSCIRYLLSPGVRTTDIDVLTKFLFQGVGTRHTTLLEFLLTTFEFTPEAKTEILNRALQNSSISYIVILIEHGARTTDMDALIKVLVKAVNVADTALLELLLITFEFTPEVKTKALDGALETDSSLCIQCLLEHGARTTNVDALTKGLVKVVNIADTALLELLLTTLFTPEVKTKALDRALETDSSLFIKYLLWYGARTTNMDALTKGLAKAVNVADTAFVEFLLTTFEFTPEVKTKALDGALLAGSDSVAAILLRHEACPSQDKMSKAFPFVILYAPHRIKEFLSADVDLSASYDGALRAAVVAGNMDCVKLLLERGANRLAPDTTNSHTPYTIAAANDFSAIASLVGPDPVSETTLQLKMLGHVNSFDDKILVGDRTITVTHFYSSLFYKEWAQLLSTPHPFISEMMLPEQQETLRNALTRAYDTNRSVEELVTGIRAGNLTIMPLTRVNHGFSIVFYKDMMIVCDRNNGLGCHRIDPSKVTEEMIRTIMCRFPILLTSIETMPSTDYHFYWELPMMLSQDEEIDCISDDEHCMEFMINLDYRTPQKVGNCMYENSKLALRAALGCIFSSDKHNYVKTKLLSKFLSIEMRKKQLENCFRYMHSTDEKMQELWRADGIQALLVKARTRLEKHSETFEKTLERYTDSLGIRAYTR